MKPIASEFIHHQTRSPYTAIIIVRHLMRMKKLLVSGGGEEIFEADEYFKFLSLKEYSNGFVKYFYKSRDIHVVSRFVHVSCTCILYNL